MRLLFDLDGTLTNSFIGITNCIQHALGELGRRTPAPHDLRWCIGPPLRESFLTLLDTTDAELADDAVRLYRERYETVGLFENEVYPDIVETLDALSQQGHQLSVATSKPTEFAVRIVDHFGLDRHFQCVNGCGLDGSHGDKTSLISHLMERDDIDSDSVVMIGDRKHDVIGANANGIPAIGVLWGFGSLEELETAGAHQCVSTPAELPAVLHSLR